MVQHPPEDNGRSGNVNIYFLFLFYSIHKIANSGAFFHTEATRGLDLSQRHNIMQGQLSTTVTPEKDFSRVDLAACGLWGLGVGSLSAILQG